MKISTRLLLSLACLFLLKNVSAQDKKYEPKDPKLYQTILHMDSMMFDAFNSHNLEELKILFAPNIEFYHDRGGLQDYQAVINGFKGVFAATPDLRRELVPGTLEVYPIPGFGAIEIGVHRFVHVENGQTQIGVYRFIQTWQLKDGVWKVTRVVSVGH
jgi:hypothetical protein